MYARSMGDTCITLTLYEHRCDPLDRCPNDRQNDIDSSQLKVAFGRMLRGFHAL
jgi:hypothetical protein